MFPERARFMQDINEVIEIFPEEKDDEILRSAKNRPKKKYFGIGIDRLVMFLMGRHTSRGNVFHKGTIVKK